MICCCSNYYSTGREKLEMDIFYIVFGFILFVMGWLEFALSKLMRRKREAGENWVRIETMLKARAVAILEFTETVENLGIMEPEIKILYKMKGGYTISEDRDLVAEMAEKVTPFLYSLIEKLKLKNIDVKKAAEILEMDDELEIMARSFNKYVYLHNEIMTWKKYKLQILILRPNPLRDFILKREM